MNMVNCTVYGERNRGINTIGVFRLRAKKILLAAILATAIGIAGCGGGGGGSTSVSDPPLGTKTLTWDNVTEYTDNTTISAGDLLGYEVYVKETSDFSGSDNSIAFVAAGLNSLVLTDPVLGLQRNKTYYVSVRAEARTGVKSSFSDVLSFSLL